MKNGAAASARTQGLVLAVCAYVIWGLFPLYWPLLKPATPWEILAHRIIWSLIFTLVAVVLGSRWALLARIVANRRRLLLLTAAGIVMSANWGLYIWAINNGKVVETSLGYFINPFITVLIGVVVLRERLRTLQWASLGIGGLALIILTLAYGKPPWLPLGLAFCFGTYSLLKKLAGVGGVEGLVIEAAVATPLAVLYLVFLESSPSGTLVHGSIAHAMLLVSSGLVTAFPLLLFSASAVRLSLSDIGLLQYILPTMQFLIGVLYYHEPMSVTRLMGFILVWVAILILSADVIKNSKTRQPVIAPEFTT